MIEKEKLRLFGLTDAEAEIYTYLLEHGSSSATQISKVVKVGRTNVYDHTKDLEELGLVKQIEKNNKLFFEAESPLRLKELGEKKIAESKDITNFITELLPKLALEYYKQQNLPLITYMNGLKGFEDLNDILYLKGADTEVFYFLPDLKKYEPPEPKYRFSIQKKNIFTYLFVKNAENIESFVKDEEKELRKTKVVSLPIEKEIIIFEDKVIMGHLSKDDFSVMLITDYDLANILRGLIKMLS